MVLFNRSYACSCPLTTCYIRCPRVCLRTDGGGADATTWHHAYGRLNQGMVHASLCAQSRFGRGYVVMILAFADTKREQQPDTSSRPSCFERHDARTCLRGAGSGHKTRRSPLQRACSTRTERCDVTVHPNHVSFADVFGGSLGRAYCTRRMRRPPSLFVTPPSPCHPPLSLAPPVSLCDALAMVV